MRDSRMLPAAGVMGISGLLAQMVLLRELLIVFAGNELTIGLIFSNWLLTEAAGSFWAGRTTVQADRGVTVRRYALISLVFCVCLIPSVYGVRLIKPLLGMSIGTVPGLELAAVSSLVLMLPVSFTHGALFTVGCAGFAGSVERDVRVAGSSISGIYVLETAGTLLGGVLWTWLLVPFADAFQIAVGVVLINVLTVFYLLKAPAVLLLAAATLLLFAGGTGWLQRRSVDSLWEGQNVVHYENSMVGNVAVTENEGQYSFFTDGTLAFISPVPDLSLVEPYVHIPMAAHPRPERVLLIGGGGGGFLNEILLHPSVTRVDYTELDPLLLELQRRYADHSAERWLNDPRVISRIADGRAMLQESSRTYDIIMSRTDDPSSLHSNRYFSREFFRLADRRLTDRGILVLGFPGLVGHLTEPLRDLSAGVYHSLRKEFPYVRVFPGEGHSFLLASRDPSIQRMDVDGFIDVLHQREMLAAISIPRQIEQRLHPRWHTWFEEFAGAGAVRVNRDFLPRSLLLSIAHWSSLNAPLAGRLLEVVYPLHPAVISAILILVLLLVSGVTNGRSSRPDLHVVPAVLTTGFTAMVVNLSLIFAFQIAVGRLFGWIGLLTAAFITGLGIGALITTYRLRKGRSAYLVLIKTDAAVLLAGALLLILLPISAPKLASFMPPSLFRALFFVLLLCGGMACGAQFPAAGRSLLAGRTAESDLDGGTARTAGLVYGADLLGGCLGGILGGVLLVPLLGLTGIGVTVGVLKGVSLALLLSSLKKTGTKEAQS